jgi:hypothetical protein
MPGGNPVRLLKLSEREFRQQTMVRAALEGVRDLIDRLALREQLLANDAGFSFSIAGMQQAGALLTNGGSVVRSTPQ